MPYVENRCQGILFHQVERILFVELSGDYDPVLFLKIATFSAAIGEEAHTVALIKGRLGMQFYRLIFQCRLSETYLHRYFKVNGGAT